MSEKESPESPKWNDDVKQDNSAGTGWYYTYRHRRFDKEGNLIPPKTGVQRQKAYEQEQRQGDKKRPGWWLSGEVIKTITDRQWEHPRRFCCVSGEVFDFGKLRAQRLAPRASA